MNLSDQNADHLAQIAVMSIRRHRGVLLGCLVCVVQSLITCLACTSKAYHFVNLLLLIGIVLSTDGFTLASLLVHGMDPCNASAVRVPVASLGTALACWSSRGAVEQLI